MPAETVSPSGIAALSRPTRRWASSIVQPVAGLVPAVVVELLEAVEVEHRHADRARVAGGARELARKLLVPGTPVRQPGQVVRAGRLLELDEQPCPVERDRRLGGQ